MNSTVSRLGSLIAIAIIGARHLARLPRPVDAPDAVPLGADQRGPKLRDASIDAFRAGMLIAAGLAFAGAAVGGVGISNRELARRRGQRTGTGASRKL